MMKKEKKQRLATCKKKNGRRYLQHIRYRYQIYSLFMSGIGPETGYNCRIAGQIPEIYQK